MKRLSRPFLFFWHYKKISTTILVWTFSPKPKPPVLEQKVTYSILAKTLSTEVLLYE